ncbi:MAG: nucleotidyltransferase domain-containing protein [bacterium]|nr:nucleotidyltransferase domain-containing protein [bacterium]
MMIDNTIRSAIEKELERIEQENNLEILYACESGSRGWGFPSPNSDYDVRFIYIRPEEWYLSISEKRDTLNFPIADDLDIEGWDIRKVLKHIMRSNPTIQEWLRSPVIYSSRYNLADRLKELSGNYFAPIAFIHHYLGIAKNSMRALSETSEIKIKKLFYVLRPLFAALWAGQKKEIPPMEFSILLEMLNNPSVKQKIDELLKLKEVSEESKTIILDPEMHDYIEAQFTVCELLREQYETQIFSPGQLDKFFFELLKGRKK